MSNYRPGSKSSVRYIEAAAETKNYDRNRRTNMTTNKKKDGTGSNMTSARRKNLSNSNTAHKINNAHSGENSKERVGQKTTDSVNGMPLSSNRSQNTLSMKKKVPYWY